MRSIRRLDPDIERRWLDETRRIAMRVLAPFDLDLYLFGSRASGNARIASDIDLAFDPREPIPGSVLARLADEFEESLVPVRVDLVDLSQAADSLRQRVRAEGIRWIASQNG